MYKSYHWLPVQNIWTFKLVKEVHILRFFGTATGQGSAGHPHNTIWNVICKQERPLGQRKTPPTNKYIYVTSTLHVVVAVCALTILRTFVSPLAMLFGHLDIFHLSLTIGPNFCTLHFSPYQTAIFLKIESFLPVGGGNAPTKIELNWSNKFWDILLTDISTEWNNINQEKPLGQRKTSPANKVSLVTPRSRW